MDFFNLKNSSIKISTSSENVALISKHTTNKPYHYALFVFISVSFSLDLLNMLRLVKLRSPFDIYVTRKFRKKSTKGFVSFFCVYMYM